MKIEDSELNRLADAVKQEIDSYVYRVPEHSMGSAWAGEKVDAAIEKMRACLVEPYWIDVEVRDTFEQVADIQAKKARCAVVADDHTGVLLVWDASAQDYCLVQQQAGDSATSFGVRGDAVGCFLSR
jgi:hypothetical protein